VKKNIDLTQLYKQKRYSEIIYIIESEFSEDEKNISIIYLLGLCRLLKNNRTIEDLFLAIKNFKTVFNNSEYNETSSRAFKNFIHGSVDLYDAKNSENYKEDVLNFFNEALNFFNKNKSLFLNDELLVLAIIRIYKRLVDMENVKFYLEELIKRRHFRPLTLCSYIYNNCFFQEWSQDNFLKYGKILDQNLPSYNPKNLVAFSKNSKKKIIVGFLSADIRQSHSVTYFLKTVIDNYDKNIFSINLYLNFNKRQEDETTKYFIKKVDKADYIKHLNDEDVINIIRKDEVDIFIDLMGVTSDSRLSLSKNRVAPAQILWCGYCNTTGIKEMDYIISDPNLILPSEKNSYLEKVIYLPKIWNCHSGFNMARSLDVPPFISNGFITFGSFNNFSKINDNVVKTWSKILRSIKNSKLILKTSNRWSSNLLRDKFNQENVLSSVEFIQYEKNFESHLNLYKKIDIALDTFPYNGVTTSFEAYWMNVPVLTMMGYNFNSRCGESINKNLSLEYLIAQNEEDYILKAKELSFQTDKLVNLRKEIFENLSMSPLFDVNSFSNDFFNVLKKLKFNK